MTRVVVVVVGIWCAFRRGRGSNNTPRGMIVLVRTVSELPSDCHEEEVGVGSREIKRIVTMGWESIILIAG